MILSYLKGSIVSQLLRKEYFAHVQTMCARPLREGGEGGGGLGTRLGVYSRKSPIRAH